MTKLGALRLLLVSLCVGLCACADCERIDPCSCEFDDGSGTIDLTSLGRTDDTPRFKDVICKADGSYYSYNPCGGFNEERACMEAALCMLSEDKSDTQMLGAARETDFKYDEDSDHVVAGYVYHGISLGYSEVEMICDVTACEPAFEPLGLVGGTYKMQLRSICACPGKCTATGPEHCDPSQPSGGLSVGFILIIGFFAILVVYLVGGVVFMKVGKKKSGSDLIPNKGMWLAFPTLVTGGFRFLYGKVSSRKSGYQTTN